MFAALREASGLGEDMIDAPDVATLLIEATKRYGPDFGKSLGFSTIAVNGVTIAELKGELTQLSPDDEVALLPPVSGG